MDYHKCILLSYVGQKKTNVLRFLFQCMSVHLVKLLKSTYLMAKDFLLGTVQKRWVVIQALDGNFRGY